MLRPRLLCRPELQQPDNQSRPPGLGRRSKSAARVAVEVFLESNVVRDNTDRVQELRGDYEVHSASCLNPGYANAPASRAQSRAATPQFKPSLVWSLISSRLCAGWHRRRAVRIRARSRSDLPRPAVSRHRIASGDARQSCEPKSVAESKNGAYRPGAPMLTGMKFYGAASSGRHDPVTPVALDVIAIEHHHLVPDLDEVLHEALLATAAGIHVGDGTQLRIRPEDQVVA